MSWRIPGVIAGGIAAAFVVFWIAASLASPPVYIWWPHYELARVVLEADCELIEQQAAELFPLAQICGFDSDCFHYPCSCSSLARGWRAEEYMRVRKELQSSCEIFITHDYCGETVPVCRDNRCSVEVASGPPTRPGSLSELPHAHDWSLLNDEYPRNVE